MITGTLTAVNGRRLTVGGAVYELPQDGKVLKGIWPKFTTLALSDLKTGQHVALHGPPKGSLHSVRILSS